MASLVERIAAAIKEQEGKVDAPTTGTEAPAIDSEKKPTISPKGDVTDISIPDFMVRGSGEPVFTSADDKGAFDSAPTNKIANARDRARGTSGEKTQYPMSEQLARLFERVLKAPGRTAGDVVEGIGMTREHPPLGFLGEAGGDDLDYIVDRNIDISMMSDTELAELRRKHEGGGAITKAERKTAYDAKKQEFINLTRDFANAMPELPPKKTTGWLGYIDDVATATAQEGPMMIAGGATKKIGGPFVLNYFRIMPDKYKFYKQAGLDEDRAVNYASGFSAASGLIEGSGDLIQLGRLKKALKIGNVTEKVAGPLRKYLGGIIKVGGTEGLEELTQGHLEVIFDVYALNQGETDEEKIKRVFEIFKTPEFQKEKLYDAAVGFGVGGVMSVGAQAAGDLTNRIFGTESVPGVKIKRPDETEDFDADVTNIGDSDADKDVDVDTRPSVANLMGVGDKANGISVSGDPNVTDTQASNQLKTTDVVKQVVQTMSSDRGMKQAETKINTTLDQIDTIKAHLDDAVIAEDPRGALQMAQMVDQKVDELGDHYSTLLDLSNTKAEANNSVVDPQDASEIQAYYQNLKTESTEAIQQQTIAVGKLDAIANQAYADNLGTEKGLKDELITANVDQSRQTGQTTKVNSAVITEIMNKESIGDLAYLEQVKIPALNKLKAEAITQRMLDQRNLQRGPVDPKTGAQLISPAEGAANAQAMARSDAIIAWVDETLLAKSDFNLNKARQDKTDQDFKEFQAEAKTEAQAEAKAEVKAKAAAQAKVVSAAEEKTKVKRQKAEAARTADLARKVRERQATVSEQKALLRKPVPGPGRKIEAQIAKEAAEAKATREAEIKKQQAVVAELDKGSAEEVKTKLPAGVRFDHMGEKGTTTPEGEAQVTITDPKSPAFKASFSVKVAGDIKAQVKAKVTEFTKAQAKASKVNVEDMKIDATVATKARELFRGAAVLLPDGTIAEGTSHIDIVDRVIGIEKLIQMPMEEANKMKDGFVTHAGEFVERGKAAEMVGKTGDETLYSEDFLKALKPDDKRGRRISVAGATDADQISDMVDVLDAETGKYQWLLTFAKALGIKTNVVFGKKGLQKHPVYQALPARNKAGMMADFDKVLGRADPNTFTTFINAQNLIGRKLTKADELLAHEPLHGVVRKVLSKLPRSKTVELESDLHNLWANIPQEVKDAAAKLTNTDGTKPISTGITQVNDNIHELITYGMTNPEFAQWLNSMPSTDPKTGNKTTIWKRLVDMIANIIRPSKLTDLRDILNAHLPMADPGMKRRLIRFSKEDITFDFGANVTKANVQTWADELHAKSANAVETEIVANAQEAIDVLGFDPGDTAVSFWIGASTEKIYPRGVRKYPAKVVIIADRIQSEEHLVAKWMHEQVAHQGLRNVFGDNTALFNRFLDQAYSLFTLKEKTLIEQVAELEGVGKIKSGKLFLTPPEKRRVAEEIIARKGEKLQPVTKRGLLTRMKKFLAKWLPKRFVDVKTVTTIADSDIMAMLEMARENVLTGEGRFGLLMDKALKARAPKHKFAPYKTLPNFVESDETYKSWVKELVKAAPTMRKWYSQHTETLKKAFGKDFDLFSVLLAVTSPQADVTINVQFAVDTYAYMMGLTDKPGALFPNKLKKRIDSNWTSPEAMLKDLESTVFKVTEFGRALLGDTDATVGDLWMFRALFGDPAVYNKESETFLIPQVTAMRQKLFDLASQLSEETGDVWTPRDVQAAIWTYVNAKQTGKSFSKIANYQTGLNRPTIKYDGKTPLEWLQSVVPNLSEGPLSDRIGLETVPTAPVSPLAKKLVTQLARETKGTYPVSAKGVIKVLSPDQSNKSIIKLIRAIVKGGRLLTANNAQMADWYRQVFGFEIIDGLDMRLTDEALGVFTNEKGIVTEKSVRDNLGGFSGNYTREVRFSREARSNLDQIAAMADKDNVNGADEEFLRTGNDGRSALGKIHEWRDQAELNINRLTKQLEQEFLEKFGGRKAGKLIPGLRSGRMVNTADTELLQKAMNLYIDSGTGKNLEKVTVFANKLLRKSKLTVRENIQLKIIERMLSLSTEERNWADSRIRGYYQEFFDFANEHGIINSQVDNYVRRMWRLPKEFEGDTITWSGSGTTGFKLTASSGKQRTFDSIIDGWDLGMDLQANGIIANIQAYANEIGYVFSNRRFVEYMSDMIDFKTDGLMFQSNKLDDFEPGANYARVNVRGFALPGKVLYARKDLARELNELQDDPWAMWNNPVAQFIRRINASIKSTILSISMFHHLAGMRSWGYGVKGIGPIQRVLGGIRAYKRGLDKLDKKTGFTDKNYKHLGPIVDLLVREGLTIGRTQDWDEIQSQQSLVSDVLANRTSGVAKLAEALWQEGGRRKRSLVTGLFGNLFAGLKAEAGSAELIHRIKKVEKQTGQPATDAEIKLAAQQTAQLINADFGGLHLKRMGRSINTQRVLQLTFLAPDWTESNWRTVVGAIPFARKLRNRLVKDPFNQRVPDMEKVYFSFWAGIMKRAVLSVALAQAAILYLAGDDDDREEYWDAFSSEFTWETFDKGEWAKVDFTPVARKLGVGDPRKRQRLNLIGHFKDILKVMDVRSLIKHKVSPVVRVGETAWSGKDWKGDQFTTLKEMIETGQIVREGEREQVIGSTFWSTMPSWFFYNVRQSIPIAGSNFVQYLQGEASGMQAVANSAGLDVRDKRPNDVNERMFWDIDGEVKKLDRALSEARLTRDRGLIREAKADIKEYKGFNRIKSRIGFTRMQIKPIRDKMKALELKRERLGWTERDVKKYRKLAEQKAEKYSKFAEVIKR